MNKLSDHYSSLSESMFNTKDEVGSRKNSTKDREQDNTTKSYEKKKSRITSSYTKNRDSHTRECEMNDLWAIWHQPYEAHSFDYNIELMNVANRYFELINHFTNNVDSLANPETHLSSHSVSPKFNLNDESKLTFNMIKVKYDKLVKNVNFKTVSSQISPAKSEIVKVHASHEFSKALL